MNSLTVDSGRKENYPGCLVCRLDHYLLPHRLLLKAEMK